MTEEEEFQYVVSGQDYKDFKTSQAKCQELTKLLAESEEMHSQDKGKYLSKLEKLQDELKTYRNSIRHYVEKQIKQIDSLLKILHDYKLAQTKSGIDQKSLTKIKTECDKIAQTFNVSLKDLQILNSQVIIVIKSLVGDCLALQQKLKEYSQQYENVLQQKQDLYSKVRQLNEKSLIFDKDKDKFIKTQQKLKYQIELLKITQKDKQNQNNQLRINIQNNKNKYNTELNLTKQENILIEKRWKEKIYASQQRLQKEIVDVKNQKLLSTKTMIEQIQKLRSKIKCLEQGCALKQNTIKELQVAYKQQSQKLQNIKYEQKQKQQQLLQKQQLLRQKNQRLICQYQQKISCYQREMNKITFAYQQRLMAQQKDIQQLCMQISENKKKIQQLQRQLQEKKRIQQQLQRQIEQMQKTQQQYQQRFKEIHQVQDMLQLQNRSLKQQSDFKIQDMKKQLKMHTQRQNCMDIALSQSQKCAKNLQSQLCEYKQKHQLQSFIVQKLKSDFNKCKQDCSHLHEELAIKNQRLSMLQNQLTNNNNQLADQLQFMRKTVTICQSERNSFETKCKQLRDQLIASNKSSQQQKNQMQSQIKHLKKQLDNIRYNFKKQTMEQEQLQKAYIDITSSNTMMEAQICSMKQLIQKEKRKNNQFKNQTTNLINESNMMRQTFSDYQLSNQSLLKEIQTLRYQSKSSQQVQQASHLLKMNLQTLQTQVQRLSKQNNLIKKQRQALSQEIIQAKEQIKFATDDLTSMRQYIDQLEQNLQKLSQEKAALKNQILLFKEEAQFCKHQSIEQLGIIDKLERQLEATKKQLKNAEQFMDPASIVRRSSLSKGQKSYYVKEMILEYSNEMKKNLQEIGALEHEQIKDLIFSELRQLGNYLKKLEKQFQ